MRLSFPIHLVLVTVLAGCGEGATTPPPRETLARDCVFAKGCFTDGLEGTVSSCVESFQWDYAGELFTRSGLPAGEVSRLAACGASATTCSDYLDCISMHHTSAYCASHSGLSCDGSILVQCLPDGWGQPTDCAAIGMSCTEANGSASCTDGRACDPSVELAHCDGTRWVGCNLATHTEEAFDCAAVAHGWTCAAIAGEPKCIPNTPACTSGSTRCDGDTLVTCPADLLHEVRIDCAATFGAHCSPSGTNCVYPDGACSASSETCVGTQLQTCIDGRSLTVDCTALGFRTCESSAGGGARCAN